MNHFHNILGISPEKAIAVSQQDVWLYWVKRVQFLFCPVSNLEWFEVKWYVTERHKLSTDIILHPLLSFIL